MHTLKIGKFRLISCLYKCFKSSLDKRCSATTQHCLLPKEVCFRFFCKGGFYDASPGAANPMGIRQRLFLGRSRGVLMDSHKTRNGASFFKFTTDKVSGSLGCYHNNVNIGWRHNLSKMDVKSM